MRLEQFRYVAEVAKTNSIRLASENLFVSQPAISTAITKLEQELGADLFIRSKNGVFLTPIGEQILYEITATFEHIDQIKKIASEKRYELYQNISGTFSFRIPPAISISIFSDLMAHLQAIFPKVNFHCYESSPEEIRKEYASNKYDLNIFSTIVNTKEPPLVSFEKDHSNLVLQRLYSCRLFVSAGKQTEIAKKTHISLEELIHYPIACLGYTANETDYIQRLFTKKNKILNISFKTTNIDHLIKQIKSGACYSITDSLSIITYRDISHIPIIDPIKLQMWVSYYTTNKYLPIITETIHFIQKYVPKSDYTNETCS